MAKHEKVLIGKGKLGILKKTISIIGEEFPDFKDKFEEIEFYGE